MGAPINNKNAYGSTGGGRKSARQERETFDYLWDLWGGSISLDSLEKAIGSRQFGAKEMFAYKVFTGDDKALCKLFDKLYPNAQPIIEDYTYRDELDELREKLKQMIDNAKNDYFPESI